MALKLNYGIVINGMHGLLAHCFIRMMLKFIELHHVGHLGKLYGYCLNQLVNT